MPGLSGQAGKGRLIYLVELEAPLCVPLFIYTHARYATRPKDKDLKKTAEGEMA